MGQDDSKKTIESCATRKERNMSESVWRQKTGKINSWPAVSAQTRRADGRDAQETAQTYLLADLGAHGALDDSLLLHDFYGVDAPRVPVYGPLDPARKERTFTRHKTGDATTKQAPRGNAQHRKNHR